MSRRNITEKDARGRNLLISIAKGVVKVGAVSPTYSKNDIVKLFYFSQRDMKYQLNSFFLQENESFVLKPHIHEFLKKVITANNYACAELERAEAVFLKRFGQYNDCWRKSYSTDFYAMKKICEEMKEIVPILHWGRLPILNKYLMINSGLIPEENIEEFYSDYDMLYAMLKDIRGEGENIKMNGDKTLNRELSFSVYTRRWGHTDNYIIYRTIDGWEVKHIAINGLCEKDGTGALIMNLQHDAVFYPEDGVKYALSQLWEQSDEGKLDIDELQTKLQQIADWISTVERAVGDGQPDWVGYY